jgi:hypothetical protein
VEPAAGCSTAPSSFKNSSLKVRGYVKSGIGCLIFLFLFLRRFLGAPVKGSGVRDRPVGRPRSGRRSLTPMALAHACEGGEKVVLFSGLSVGWGNHPAFVSGKFVVCACSSEVPGGGHVPWGVAFIPSPRSGGMEQYDRKV